jgi:hypothetical protein
MEAVGLLKSLETPGHEKIVMRIGGLGKECLIFSSDSYQFGKLKVKIPTLSQTTRQGWGTPKSYETDS